MKPVEIVLRKERRAMRENDRNKKIKTRKNNTGVKSFWPHKVHPFFNNNEFFIHIMLSNIHKHSFYKSEYGTIIENIMQYFTS
jgi:hypothetical protein